MCRTCHACYKWSAVCFTAFYFNLNMFLKFQSSAINLFRLKIDMFEKKIVENFPHHHPILPFHWVSVSISFLIEHESYKSCLRNKKWQQIHRNGSEIDMIGWCKNRKQKLNNFQLGRHRAREKKYKLFYNLLDDKLS